MTARGDLAELEALASAISDDVTDFRQRRRKRTDDLITARIAAAQAAPKKQRVRRRSVAAGGVAVLAVATATVLVMTRPAPPRNHTKPAVTAGTPAQQAGQRAARHLADVGRTANLFDCDDAAVQAHVAAAAMRDYLAACQQGTGTSE